MKKKIMGFIVNEKKQLLLLRNNPQNPKYGGDFWYVVTGNFDCNEVSASLVAKREIKEETNLDVLEIIYLNWVFIFNNNQQWFKEYVYIAFVKNEKIILNEENIEYQWCDLEEFLKKIHWNGNLKILEKVLTKAISKKFFFKKEKTEKYEQKN